MISHQNHLSEVCIYQMNGGRRRQSYRGTVMHRKSIHYFRLYLKWALLIWLSNHTYLRHQPKFLPVWRINNIDEKNSTNFIGSWLQHARINTLSCPSRPLHEDKVWSWLIASHKCLRCCRASWMSKPSQGNQMYT